MKRPSFQEAWNAFLMVRQPVSVVGKIIGGNVQKNIEIPENEGGFANACPIRMSYVLNKTGAKIQRSPQWGMVTGGDANWYIYRVKDMMSYLESTFGKPDKIVTTPKPSDFSGMKGIIVVKGRGWGNASGHVTIWNGTSCADSCHLLHDPDNGSFTPDTAAIWILK